MKESPEAQSEIHEFLDWTIKISQTNDGEKLGWDWIARKGNTGNEQQYLRSRNSWSRKAEAMEDAIAQVNGESLKNDVLPAIKAAFKRLLARR